MLSDKFESKELNFLVIILKLVVLKKNKNTIFIHVPECFNNEEKYREYANNLICIIKEFI